jgi:hypothetical protein
MAYEVISLYFIRSDSWEIPSIDLRYALHYIDF